MPQLSEVIQAENTFYSIRSDGSAMFVLKVDDVSWHSSSYPVWVYMRTDANGQVHSSQWGFLKMDGKDTVSFPLVTSDELKKRALASDFVEWQGGLMTPMQSESDMLLDKRIHAFFADLDARTQQMQADQRVIDASVEKAIQRIKGEASRVEVIAEEVREKEARVESRRSHIEAYIAVQETKIGHTINAAQEHLEKVSGSIHADIEAQKPLSAEMYRQYVARRSSWISLSLILAAIIFVGVLLYAPIFSGINTVLVEVFAGVAVILSVISAIILACAIFFFSRMKIL